MNFRNGSEAFVCTSLICFNIFRLLLSQRRTATSLSRQCGNAFGQAGGRIFNAAHCGEAPFVKRIHLLSPTTTKSVCRNLLRCACHHEAEHIKLTRSFDPRGTRRADAQLAHAECNFMDTHVSSPQRSRTTTLSFSWYQSSPRNFIPGECGEGLFQHVADVPLPFFLLLSRSAPMPHCNKSFKAVRRWAQSLGGQQT